MTIRPRFSLRLLVLLVSCASLFLGYSQWRRQAILKVCAGLKEDGYVFEVPNALLDNVWQRRPVVATVDVHGPAPMMAFDCQGSSEVARAITEDKNEIERLRTLGVVEYADDDFPSPVFWWR